MQNASNTFDLRERITDFFKGYCFLLSEAKYKAKHGRVPPSNLAVRLKIFTPTRILQRLSIALAQAR